MAEVEQRQRSHATRVEHPLTEVTVFGRLNPRSWRDMSDGELRLRLDDRGVRPGDAAMMVAKRETQLGELLIDNVFLAADV